ncbi:hypothetical protein DPMN_000628 [Dreissena polymorpha]|uniref:Uncharacterized protein n=1 Tax=Dreissena polymorpha TaxID=45954 RepID=A0A9D4RRZ3_DREPO|nr:hypothetical protein DPMN_000628 [Dreissena polymorpha]
MKGDSTVNQLTFYTTISLKLLTKSKRFEPFPVIFPKPLTECDIMGSSRNYLQQAFKVTL